MLSFPAAIKVYLCTVACDMRRSFDGLSMMAEHIIRCDPYAGHLLVFCNRRSDRIKILYWDRDGWAIWYKRLEGQGRNTTEFVKPQDVAEVEKQLATYKRFRALTNEWVEISVELARLRKKRGSDGV